MDLDEGGVPLDPNVEERTSILEGPSMSIPSLTSLLSQPKTRLPPTVQSLTTYLGSFFPSRARDVPFEYHVPRAAWFNATIAPVTRVILSVTPTEGVYTALKRSSKIPPVAFLHRPFGLDRRQLKRGSTVLSSHVGFDEVLTVGWNVALAAKLGVAVDRSACLQGYKGDPDRRIGLVGPIRSTVGELVSEIKAQFGATEGAFGFDAEDISSLNHKIVVLAIMNAFHPDEVDRVLAAADQFDDQINGSQILYLTGGVREEGLKYALDKGLKVLCVGHRSCEEWGIRFLASQIRQQFPTVEVEDIYEAEPPPVKRTKPNGPNKPDGTNVEQQAP